DLSAGRRRRARLHAARGLGRMAAEPDRRRRSRSPARRSRSRLYQRLHRSRERRPELMSATVAAMPSTLRHGPPVYELAGVSKTYARNAVHALENINLTLNRGSFSSVIGSSGCGKSTLLKIMAGLVPPSRGRVTLAGRPVTGPRRDIGMMFQQATLFPWRTTIENVVLPIEIRDGHKAARAAHDRARGLLELVGLKGFDKAYPNQLSGGMAQRAAICRMLVTGPEVLLLDEPFSALDELSRDFMNVDLQSTLLDQSARAF